MDAFVLQMTLQESTQCTHNSMGVKSCFMYPRFYRGRQITANRYSMTCFLFHWNVTSLLQCGKCSLCVFVAIGLGTLKTKGVRLVQWSSIAPPTFTILVFYVCGQFQSIST